MENIQEESKNAKKSGLQEYELNVPPNEESRDRMVYVVIWQAIDGTIYAGTFFDKTGANAFVNMHNKFFGNGVAGHFIANFKAYLNDADGGFMMKLNNLFDLKPDFKPLNQFEPFV